MVQHKQAFTLIEILVVVLIIGILAAVALPQYQKAVEKSRAMQAILMVKAIGDAQEVYFLANGMYATTLDDLDIEVPGENYVFSKDEHNRKKYGKFDFGVSGGKDGLIAISNRWANISNDSGTLYYLYRLANDSNIYCIESQDPYNICVLLSGGKSVAGKGYLVH